MQVLLLVSREWETFFERVSNTVKLGVVKKVNTQKSRKNEKGVGKSVTCPVFCPFRQNLLNTYFVSQHYEFQG